MNHTKLDWERRKRTGLPEVIFAEFKSLSQLRDIVDAHVERGEPLLVTRLTAEQISGLQHRELVVNENAGTATYAAPDVSETAPTVGVVCAGTSDWRVAAEVCETARFFGLNTQLHADLGVAGLWRLQNNLGELAEYPVLVAVAGMEGALFSVLAGLVSAPVIAVPTSVGYGVAREGRAALSSALASCAPGVVTVNIDNGFGAAAAAYKILSVRPAIGSASDQ